MSAPSVLEKAARALCELEGGNWDAKSFSHTPAGNDPEEMRQGYFDQARAVLMALLVDVETSLGSPYSADDAIGPVLRSILAEKPE